MDTKDPVWDDDDSSPGADGFRPHSKPPVSSEPPLSQQADDSVPEPVAEPVTEPVPQQAVPAQSDAELSLPEPEASAPDESESASAAEPSPEPVPIPMPGTDRVRIEPVDSFRRSEAGGSRAARDRRQRSSASMVIIALILFLISVISISVYFFSRPAESGAQGETEQVEFIDPGQSAPAESTQPPESSQQETTTPAPEQPSAEQAPPPPPPGATMKSAAAAAASSSSGGSGREQTPKDLAESRAPRVEPEPEPAPKAKPEPAPKAKPEPVTKAPSKDLTREQAPSRNAVPAPSSSLKTSKSASSAGAQWVIQVHSSPSVDDADEWLRQLQSRNVGDGRIEPVTQQGKVWYRVRFGRYATREEAELAALQLGYRNAWIDRVR